MSTTSDRIDSILEQNTAILEEAEKGIPKDITHVPYGEGDKKRLQTRLAILGDEMEDVADTAANILRLTSALGEMDVENTTPIGLTIRSINESITTLVVKAVMVAGMIDFMLDEYEDDAAGIHVLTITRKTVSVDILVAVTAATTIIEKVEQITQEKNVGRHKDTFDNGTMAFMMMRESLVRTAKRYA